MTNENLLVVEDNEEQLEAAKKQLGEGFLIARDYREFEYMWNKHQGQITKVLTDLYFPRGDSADFPIYEGHKIETLRILDQFIQSTFKSMYNADLAKTYKMIVDSGSAKDLDDCIVKLEEQFQIGPCNQFYEELRDKLGIGSNKCQTYEAIRDHFEAGRYNLPEGIFVAREAKKLSIPCVIVTSENHHGYLMEPFRVYLGKYVDNVSEIDGKKDWQCGIESLLK